MPLEFRAFALGRMPERRIPSWPQAYVASCWRGNSPSLPPVICGPGATFRLTDTMIAGFWRALSIANCCGLAAETSMGSKHVRTCFEIPISTNAKKVAERVQLDILPLPWLQFLHEATIELAYLILSFLQHSQAMLVCLFLFGDLGGPMKSSGVLTFAVSIRTKPHVA